MCSCSETYDDSEVVSAASDPPSEVNVCSNAGHARVRESREAIALFARCSLAFVIIGVASIVLGFGVLVTEVTAFISDSSAGPFLLGGVVAGWLFALINGALALRAGCRKPTVSCYWVNVNVGFATTTLIMHLIATTAAAFSIELNSTGCVISCYSLPLASDTPRLVMCILLCVLDTCQIVAAFKLRQHFSSQNSQAFHANARTSASAHNITVVLVQAQNHQTESLVTYAVPVTSPRHTAEPADRHKSVRLDIDPPAYSQI